MSEMQENESVERVREGLKKAASCARQLAKAQKNPAWNDYALQLDHMGVSAKALSEAGVVSHEEASAMIDRMIAHKVIAEASGKVQ
jgi:hypothetical protein